MQCHPCFDVNYIDCTDQSTFTSGGIGLRCLGGSYVNCNIIADLQTSASQTGVTLKAEYNDIRLNYNRLYKNTTALGGELAEGSYSMTVENCKFYKLNVDRGQLSNPNLSVLKVDKASTFVSDLNRATRITEVINDGLVV